MEPSRWTRVRELFDAALDLDPEQRARYLDQSCGEDRALRAEVQGLLAADASPGAAVVGLVEREPARVPSSELDGRTIGGFRILRQIGAGGIGTVYEAEQQRPQRVVAWKTLAYGFGSQRARQRFEHEADILARLQHPAIAQVLAAGTWPAPGGELPWFAMELVEGPRPIDRFAAEEALGPSQVAALLARVCEAVHYAHQRGVIHRDLKPANILVDHAGQPKVIDFGIAKVTGESELLRHTRTGEILGTLAYMSPERLESSDDDGDTAADVYALGVMLYELLARCSPFPIDGLPPTRALDLLRDHEPLPPSRTPSQHDRPPIPRELDWITMKAMARERTRRYASVAELGADLGRFLRDEPVAASPPSATYRLKKLARRHRLLLSAAAGTLVALSVGLVLALVAWRDAARSEANARREAATLLAVSEFQERILRGAQGSAEGSNVRLATVVAAAVHELESKPFADPLVEIGARNSVALSFLALGNLPEAEKHLLRARQLIEANGGPARSRYAMPVGNNLAVCYEKMGKLELAERESRATLALRVAAHGSDHHLTALARVNLASLLTKLGHPADALELAETARRTFERTAGAGDEHTIMARTAAADALAQLRRTEESDRLFDETLALAKQHLHADHPARISVLSMRTASLVGRGRNEEYLRGCEEVAAARERLVGPDHPETWTAWNNLATAFLERADYPRAETILRKIVAAQEASGLPPGHSTVVTGQNLTFAVRRQGRAAEAEQLARQNRELAERNLPKRHWLRGVVAKELGGCLRDLQRYEEAEPLLLEGAARLEAAVGQTDGRTQKVIAELVALYEAWGRPDDLARWKAKQSP